MMAFELNTDQGLQALDPNQIMDLVQGTSVKTGCTPSYSGTGTDIDIASGTVFIDGSEVSIGSTTVTIRDGDSSPRKDIIIADSNGTVSVLEGTPETKIPNADDRFNTAQPSPPDMDGRPEVVLAEIWVPADATSLSSADVRDRRILARTGQYTDELGMTATEQSAFNDVVAQLARNDFADNLEELAYDGGFFDIFRDTSKIGLRDITENVIEVDGFEDGDFTSNPQWNEAQNNGSATVQQSITRFGDNTLEISTEGGGQHLLEHDRGASDTVNDNDVYQGWLRTSTEDDEFGFSISNSSGTDQGNDGIRFNIDTNADRFIFQAFDSSGNFDNGDTGDDGVLPQTGEWYRFKIEIIPSTSTANLTVQNSSLEEIYTGSISTTGVSNLRFVQIFRQDVNQASSYFDDISFSSNEESVKIGEELDISNVVVSTLDDGDNNGTTSLKITKQVQKTDGFEDSDYTNNPTWTEPSTGGTATVQTSTVKNGSNAVEIQTTSGSGTHSIQHDRGSEDGISDGDTYQTWFRTTTTGDITYFSLTNTSGGVLGNDSVALRAFVGDFDIWTQDSSGSNITRETLGSYQANTWYRLVIEFDTSNSEIVARVYDSSDTLLYESSVITYSGTTNIQYFLVEAFDNESSSAFIDDISYSGTETYTEYVTSGFIRSIEFDLADDGFTSPPSTVVVSQSLIDQLEASEDVQFVIEDTVNNTSQTITQSEVDTEVELTNIDSTQIQVKTELSGDGSSTPVLDDEMFHFQE